MKKTIKNLKKAYIDLVDLYLDTGGEQHLDAIENLGKAMVKSDLPVEKVADFHYDATKFLTEKRAMDSRMAHALSLPLMRLLIIYGDDFRLRKAKKATEKRLKLAYQALNNTSEGVIITDHKGVIIDVNHSFCRVTGYRRREVLGQTPKLLQSGRHDELFYQQLWKRLGSCGHWSGKVWNRRKNGEIYPELLTINALYDKGGNLQNFVGIFSDISEMHKLEMQLRQAQKMEAIGVLVGGVAHDFNNMLGGIQGNVHLAKRECAAMPQLLSRLNSIDELCQRSAGVVAQMLTFARKANVDKQPLALAPLVRETCKFARVGLPADIKLELHCADPDLTIDADLTQIQQLLLNLINNARDAMESCEEPMISVHLTRMRPDAAFFAKHVDAVTGKYVYLRIDDNGSGIAEEQLDKIFDPFFTTKEVGKGTGLGLAMVYGAVQTHHGVIEVTSQVGQGTSFHIYFPLHADSRREEFTSVGVVEAEAHGAGETILLVDDEQSLLQVMEELISAMGYRVLSAADGEQALQLYRRHRHEIRLVITDVVMPGVGGVRLAKQLKKEDPNLPLIFVSGYSAEQLDCRSMVPEGEVLLSKPVAVHKLEAAIDRVMVRQRPQMLRVVG
ncbi:MAG: response regulator [Mariprofundales bacterium]|nr:response regulator [Mariprofundales bacterium]